MGFGQNTIGAIGWGTRLSVDGKPVAKTGGVTIDWTTVAALGSPVVLADGTTIPVGSKYLPMGATVVLITSVVNGSTVGKYGPFDPTTPATDGRQTLAANADTCYLLNHACSNVDPKGDNPEAIYGGKVWQARILNTGGSAHSLTGGPTLAEIKSTFPQLELVVGN